MNVCDFRGLAILFLPILFLSFCGGGVALSYPLTFPPCFLFLPLVSLPWNMQNTCQSLKTLKLRLSRNIRQRGRRGWVNQWKLTGFFQFELSVTTTVSPFFDEHQNTVSGFAAGL